MQNASDASKNLYFGKNLNPTPMTNLLDELYNLGLSTYQVDKTFIIIDQWLEKRYPVMSQVYRQQMLREILTKNRESQSRLHPLNLDQHRTKKALSINKYPVRQSI